MDRRDSYLYRAVKGDENSITELLCNLMRRKYIRNIILEQFSIEENIINLIEFEDINTQIHINDAGIPDIVIKNDKTMEFEILVEVKTDNRTHFQATQLNEYPERIKKLKKEGKYADLIYLIPDDYPYKKEAENIIKENSPFIKMVTWSKVLNALADNEIEKDNLWIFEIINFISDKILKKKIKTSFLPSEVALMYNYRDLENANSLFVKFDNLFKDNKSNILKSINNKDKWKVEKKEDENGRGYWLGGIIFIGFSFGMEAYDYQFSIAFSGEEFEIDHIRKGVDNFYYVKFDKYVLTGKDPSKDFNKAVIEIINKYYPRYCKKK